MSLRKGFARISLRSRLLALRARVLAHGERVFLVVSSDPSFPRREEFYDFAAAERRAGDLASLFHRKPFSAQERVTLDGITILVRSRTWQFDESGLVYGF